MNSFAGVAASAVTVLASAPAVAGSVVLPVWTEIAVSAATDGGLTSPDFAVPVGLVVVVAWVVYTGRSRC